MGTLVTVVCTIVTNVPSRPNTLYENISGFHLAECCFEKRDIVLKAGYFCLLSSSGLS